MVVRVPARGRVDDVSDRSVGSEGCRQTRPGESEATRPCPAGERAVDLEVLVDPPGISAGLEVRGRPKHPRSVKRHPGIEIRSCLKIDLNGAGDSVGGEKGCALIGCALLKLPAECCRAADPKVVQHRQLRLARCLRADRRDSARNSEDESDQPDEAHWCRKIQRPSALSGPGAEAGGPSRENALPTRPPAGRR